MESPINGSDLKRDNSSLSRCSWWACRIINNNLRQAQAERLFLPIPLSRLKW